MNLRNLTLMMLTLLGTQAITASPCVLTPDSCRTLAINNNKELRMSETAIQTARYNRRSAFTAYLPIISASGIYMHTGKELSLLSDDQKTSLSHIGDALSMPALNPVGNMVVDALNTDTRNMAGAAVILTQPIYMGGKIRAYNNIARCAETIASDKHMAKYQELLADVDETYWSIVALSARKRLAESYLNLVKTLDSDIEQMIAAGMATKADRLSVRVKVNEANVAIIQVDNGIELMKMRLCQICGLPLDTNPSLVDENSDEIDTDETSGSYREWENRPELTALATAVKLYDEKVKIAMSEFLPNMVMTGGYFASYPSVFNSFEKKFKGTWNIGVAVNIPILTWGDRKYKVKAARAEAEAESARLSLEETREKIELQVSQRRQKVREAHQRYAASLSNQAEADENLRYATIGLKEGVIPVSNVIEAQTAWLSAKTNLISARIDVRLANVYLKKSLGTIK